MISQLHPDTMRAILTSLLESGVVHEADLKLFLRQNPSNEMMRLVDFVHLIFCPFGHSPETATGDWCSYDHESPFSDAWSRPSHAEWFDKTLALMDELNLYNEDTFRKAYIETKKLLDEIARLKEKAPEALALGLKLLGLIEVSSENELTKESEG